MTSAPMEKEVAYGVFMPVGEGGWIHSTTAPPVPATYAYNHQYVHLEDGLDHGVGHPTPF
jgi:pyrimidine oxygenase